MKTSVALASPSVRTVVVGGYPCFDNENESVGYGHELVPVLAIRAISIENGGRESTEVCELMLWLDGRLATIEDLEEGCMAWELVVCPWDPKEDADRLADVIARVVEATRRKCEPSRKSA